MSGGVELLARQVGLNLSGQEGNSEIKLKSYKNSAAQCG